MKDSPLMKLVGFTSYESLNHRVVLKRRPRRRRQYRER